MSAVLSYITIGELTYLCDMFNDNNRMSNVGLQLCENLSCPKQLLGIET